MSTRDLAARLRADPFILALLGTVALASVLPARGSFAVLFGHLTNVAIALLLFLYGVRLSPQTAMEGARHWRLHELVLLFSFGVFPLLGLACHAAVPLGLLTPELYGGVVFLCALPSTAQSSIAFTSIARGNVAAALCSASASNLLGILLTPVLGGLLLSRHGAGLSAKALEDIVLQLLTPFVLGQVLRPLIGGFVARHRPVLGLVDRGSVLMVVYAAFSEGVVAGIWHQITPLALAGLLAVIRRDWGPRVANQVARRLVVPPHRAGGQAQYVDLPVPLERAGGSRLACLLDQVRAALDQDWPVERLTAAAAVSPRALHRRFRDATGRASGLGCWPSAWDGRATCWKGRHCPSTTSQPHAGSARPPRCVTTSAASWAPARPCTATASGRLHDVAGGGHKAAQAARGAGAPATS